MQNLEKNETENIEFGEIKLILWACRLKGRLKWSLFGNKQVFPLILKIEQTFLSLLMVKKKKEYWD